MVFVYNYKTKQFEKKSEPIILYRSNARIDTPGPEQLEQILYEEGVKSKAQLFLDGNSELRKIWESKGWTTEKIEQKYGAIMYEGKYVDTIKEKGADYDELWCAGPSPLISTDTKRENLYHWLKGPIFSFKTDNLKVRWLDISCMVLNFIPSELLVEVTSFDKENTIKYRKILDKYSRQDVKVTEAITWQELKLEGPEQLDPSVISNYIPHEKLSRLIEEKSDAHHKDLLKHLVLLID